VYPERPQGYINDYARILGDTTALEQKLDKFETDSTNEIAVVTINSLDDVSIEEYATTLFEKWGIGKEDVDNGVLLIVAVDDREVRIEVGYGLEGALPDVTAGTIIRNEITPNFSEGNYVRGVERGVEAVIQSIAGEYDREDEDTSSTNWTLIIIIIIVIAIVAIYIFSKKGKGGGSKGTKSTRKTSRTRRSSRTSWPGSFRSGGSSSSGSGGSSFGGFGGGSSGGGGASGKW